MSSGRRFLHKKKNKTRKKKTTKKIKKKTFPKLNENQKEEKEDHIINRNKNYISIKKIPFLKVLKQRICVFVNGDSSIRCSGFLSNDYTQVWGFVSLT